MTQPDALAGASSCRDLAASAARGAGRPCARRLPRHRARRRRRRPAEAKALRSDHPLIGAWALRAGDTGCTEIYRISREGTSLVTSADEVAQTRFEVADQPSAKGYYKWVDTIVKDNGKKDCSGNVTKPHTTTSYILMSETRKAFISCRNESTKACIGPFVKIEGGEI
jgi:hypothetical protein